LSEYLLRHQMEFWQKVWSEHPIGEMKLPLLCYYVDGNTKALWSKKHVKKNKVTMLGRVMGCIETLFVHDAFGRPVYFESYPGRAPMGEYILGLFQRLEKSLEGPGEVLPVNRAIVLDGASNSVRTLRAFAAQKKYHYITSLDDNQWDERKIRLEGPLRRYEYGQATLSDCEIELEDSQEKGYLITSRAIKIEWDYGKRTVLLTSLDPSVVGTSEVVKAYFDRWPNQELQFRWMKKVVSLNRVTGYGKQQQEDRKVVEKQKELQRKITGLRGQLADLCCEIEQEEEVIAQLVKEERKLREVSRIENGKRILPEKQKERFEEIGRQIAKEQREIKKIMTPKAAEFRRLGKLEREWLRLQGKERVYKIDVELDMIMTFYRIGLVNLYSYLATELFGGERVSMSRMVESIMHLRAAIEERATTKKVILEYNKKEPDMMKRLEKAIDKINSLASKTLDGKRYQFALEHTDSHLFSSA
jgi:transcription termination factor NusB